MTTTKTKLSSINETSSYYSELSLSLRAETRQSIKELKNKYDVGGLKIKLVLGSHYAEEEIAAEVLEIWSAEWEEWDEL